MSKDNSKGNGAATLTKAAQNGKAPVTTKVVTKEGDLKTQKVVKETPKEATKVIELPKVETPMKTYSLLERIERVKLLDGLVNKRQKVVSTLVDLRKFQFSADDSCELEISDSSNKTFRTGNSNLIGLLSSNLEGLLQDKVKELDAQIQDFEL